MDVGNLDNAEATKVARKSLDPDRVMRNLYLVGLDRSGLQHCCERTTRSGLTRSRSNPGKDSVFHPAQLLWAPAEALSASLVPSKGTEADYTRLNLDGQAAVLSQTEQ